MNGKQSPPVWTDVVLDDLRVLVGVDSAALAQVEDGRDGDVCVAEDLVQLAYVDGSDALDARHTRARAERLVGEVDEQTAAAAELREATRGHRGQPADRVGEMVPHGPLRPVDIRSQNGVEDRAVIADDLFRLAVVEPLQV